MLIINYCLDTTMPKNPTPMIMSPMTPMGSQQKLGQGEELWLVCKIKKKKTTLKYK